MNKKIFVALSLTLLLLAGVSLAAAFPVKTVQKMENVKKQEIKTEQNTVYKAEKISLGNKARLKYPGDNLKIRCDLDKSGFIDLADLSILLTEFSRTDCNARNNWCNLADIHHDGNVEETDLNTLLKHYGLPAGDA